MITYHNPRLAPEPLLHLLPVLVDERYHVPVVFKLEAAGSPSVATSTGAGWSG